MTPSPSGAYALPWWLDVRISEDAHAADERPRRTPIPLLTACEAHNQH